MESRSNSILIKVKHDGLKYSCDQCDHKVTLLSSLKKHIKVKHEGKELFVVVVVYHVTIVAMDMGG